MTEYEPLPGLIFILGEQFECECGENQFRVLADKSNGYVYACWCGQSYDDKRTSEIMLARIAEKEAHSHGE